MEQRTPEWFAARVGRITGSNAGAALGMNPYKSPDDLIRQMVRDHHGAPSEFVSNIATEYGNTHEPLAMMEFAGVTGIFPDEVGLLVHPKHEWLAASPDGVVEQRAVVEIKCPFSLRSAKEPVFKACAEQPHYYAQVQMEMACAQVSECYFFQWAPNGHSLEIVDFDAAWWDENFIKLHDFYQWYLSEIDNPEHLEAKEVEINTLKAKKLLDEYDDCAMREGNAAARKKEIMAELIAMAKDRDALVHGRKLTKVSRIGSVQYAKIPELKGLDLDQYRGNPSTYWKLS